jgi:succinate dehydrogenase hydrophobic anchor subunit
MMIVKGHNVLGLQDVFDDYPRKNSAEMVQMDKGLVTVFLTSDMALVCVVSVIVMVSPLAAPLHP